MEEGAIAVIPFVVVLPAVVFFAGSAARESGIIV
jgi:hypothetical protein